MRYMGRVASRAKLTDPGHHANLRAIGDGIAEPELGTGGEEDWSETPNLRTRRNRGGAKRRAAAKVKKEAYVKPAKPAKGTWPVKGAAAKGAKGAGNGKKPPAEQTCWKFGSGSCTSPCPDGRWHGCGRCGDAGHAENACTAAKGQGKSGR